VGTSCSEHAEWLVPSGVFIVTLRSGAFVNAYAAGWVVRVSEVPVMLQVAVWEQNYSFELARECDAFAAHILGQGQQDMARHFGRNSGRTMDKLAHYSTHAGASGLPILDDCLAFLECEVVFRRSFGDHLILVGHAIDSHVNRSGEPLIYRHADYE